VQSPPALACAQVAAAPPAALQRIASSANLSDDEAEEGVSGAGAGSSGSSSRSSSSSSSDVGVGVGNGGDVAEQLPDAEALAVRPPLGTRGRAPTAVDLRFRVAAVAPADAMKGVLGGLKAKANDFMARLEEQVKRRLLREARGAKQEGKRRLLEAQEGFDYNI
jgi:hypothetical protein